MEPYNRSDSSCYAVQPENGAGSTKPHRIPCVLKTIRGRIHVHVEKSPLCCPKPVGNPMASFPTTNSATSTNFRRNPSILKAFRSKFRISAITRNSRRSIGTLVRSERLLPNLEYDILEFSKTCFHEADCFLTDRRAPRADRSTNCT